MNAAEQDKERYIKEFNDYKLTDAYKSFIQKQAAQKKKIQKKEKSTTESSPSKSSSANTKSVENNVKVIIIQLLFQILNQIKIKNMN